MSFPIQRACLLLALAASPCVITAAQATDVIVPGKATARFIVQFKAPEPPAALSQLGVHVVRKLGIGAHVVQSDVALTQQAADDLHHALSIRPDVLFVDRDVTVEKQSSNAPNDTWYSRQEHLFGWNGITRRARGEFRAAPACASP